MTIKIPVGSGRFALIDDEDLALVSGYTWWTQVAKHTLYAKAEKMKRGERTRFLMHRVIMKPKAGEQIDHKNRNGLDNRRCNLRIASHSQNCANRSNSRKGGYRGVYPTETPGVFQVRLAVRPRVLYIGRFRGEVEAAKAYDFAAVKHFGEFATLNFPRVA